jgi:hypothetical protein
METKANSLRTWGLSVIVLAVIAAGFVAYGVITHKEGGLLKVCWTNNSATYVDDLEGEGEKSLACKNPTPLIWPQKQIPLSVVVLGANNNMLKEQDEGSRLVRDAMNDFNFQIGKLVFEIAKTSEEDPDVVVIWGVPSVPRAKGSDSYKVGGYVSHTKIGGTMQAIVKIRAVAEERTAFLTVLHELGHVIALTHDDFINSLMYPRLVTTELTTTTARITDSDVRLIRTTYGL